MHTQKAVLRLGLAGALVNLAGILLSGPLGLVLVALVHPSPAWQTPQLWAKNYHPIQTVPFFFGFLLVGGYLVMMAVIHQLAEEQDKAHTSIAIMLSAAFAALIFFNYINQTTFLPALARDYRPEYDALISGFSVANPCSLGWAIEMWGYAVLGLATLFAARVFRRNALEKVTAALMIANGLVSVLGGFVTAVSLDWVMTLPGLISGNAWNVLVLALSLCYWLSLRRRLAETN
jgi:hypothetical protein